MNGSAQWAASAPRLAGDQVARALGVGLGSGDQDGEVSLVVVVALALPAARNGGERLSDQVSLLPGQAPKSSDDHGPLLQVWVGLPEVHHFDPHPSTLVAATARSPRVEA